MMLGFSFENEMLGILILQLITLSDAIYIYIYDRMFIVQHRIKFKDKSLSMFLQYYILNGGDIT